tara:strand:+ start:59 stop:778 length:720 start_codon:yes stop_codon:yes gene_type:complete
MEKVKKIKLFVGLFYLILVGLFLFFFFSKFSLQEITSYDFIKNNRNYFFDLKESNLLFLAVIFVLFSIIWVLAAGFISPLAIFAGFIFGKWLGLILLLFGMASGATGLYIIANYFFKDLVKSKFSNRFQKLESKFKKSEFLYLLIYRFVGGIPFALSNVIPCIFNVKASNFFWATLIGVAPQIFLVTSIGSGLENVVDKNSAPPEIKDIIFSPEIYVPLIAFFILVIIVILVRKFFYKK